MNKNILGDGLGIMDFIVSGDVMHVNEYIDAIGKCKDKIIIVDNADPSIVLLMREVRGVVCCKGGLTCHLACIGRELGIPVIVGVKNACNIKEGSNVQLVCENNKGTVYENDSI